MNRSIQLIAILYIFFIMLVSHTFAMEPVPKEPWKGKLRDGTEITEGELRIIIKKHEKWLESEGKEGGKASLAGADLSEANLTEANMMYVDLRFAVLNKANFIEANLSRAILIKAQLKHSNLNKVELTEADLTNADFTEANLSNADLVAANLSNARLSGANISEANLDRADMSHSRLIGANLNKASLFEANLREARLNEANISEADLSFTNLSNARLSGANLSNADLDRADLSHSLLYEADLSNAYLFKANLSNAKLFRANLKGVNLEEADVSNANLYEADLSNASLFKANLNNANLKGANMSGATLEEANLSNSDLSRANLICIDLLNADLSNSNLYELSGLPKIYEPKAGSAPYIPSMVELPNLEELTFNHFPHGLLDLREGFKKLGYREQERKITYALKHSETQNSLKNSLNSEHKNYYKWVEGQLNLYLFEYTSNWGMSPGRPLFILLGIMFLFSFVYMFSLIGINKRDGIWKVWVKDRVRSDLGEAEPKNLLICSKAFQIWGYGFYFSLLSAFNIGWRELNVGNWITRVQPREFTLRASGWVRSVSGIQSLISVYLLALAVLTYFGRPFDQF